MSHAQLSGLQALVVGGTGGIGRATCARLALDGATVLATGANDDEVVAYADDAAALGVDTAVLDVRDMAQIRRVVSTLERLDILVNLAGIGRGSSENTEDGFIQTVDINLHGTMRTCYAARELLGVRGGAIVNTASMMSFFGSATAPAYASSKGGVVQFTKSLAIALGPSGVRVNAVAPGWITTPMTTSLFADATLLQRVLGRTPLGRLGTPADVAEGVWFLARPSSSFLTGVILPVDGGYLAV
jgi:NAD(P)-dependent dehydrogenase (short-subunit alcohol dehydrogenase family)